MYKHCVTQPAKERQRQLEAGLLAMMAHHQYENISVSDLCGYMEIPRKSFYRYFTNKDGALYALIDHTLSDFAKVFFEEGAVLNQNVAEEFFRYWLSKKDLLRALDHSNLSGVLVQRAVELAMNDQIYVPRLLGGSSLPVREYLVIFMVSGIMSLLVQWEHDGFKKTPREMAEIAAQIFPQSMKASNP